MITKEKIIKYLMTTPKNTNRNVLESILSDSLNKEAIISYAMKTSYNMNKAILESLIGNNSDTDENSGNDGGNDTVAKVNSAIVGIATVG